MGFLQRQDLLQSAPLSCHPQGLGPPIHRDTHSQGCVLFLESMKVEGKAGGRGRERHGTHVRGAGGETGIGGCRDGGWGGRYDAGMRPWEQVALTVEAKGITRCEDTRCPS